MKPINNQSPATTGVCPVCGAKELRKQIEACQQCNWRINHFCGYHAVSVRKLIFTENECMRTLTTEDIEKTKADLDGEASMEALHAATLLRVAQEHYDTLGNNLDADGFYLKAEEAKQAAAYHEQAYWSVCRVWPTEITKAVFQNDPDEMTVYEVRAAADAKPLASFQLEQWATEWRDKNCATGLVLRRIYAHQARIDAAKEKEQQP